MKPHESKNRDEAGDIITAAISQDAGPVYGVSLIANLPIIGSSMRQAMPSRADLEQVRKRSERTAAGYEMLLAHWREQGEQLNRFKQLTRWLTGPNTGLSSEAMALCMLKINRTGYHSGKEHPHDPGDLNRCFMLVEAVPAIKEYFGDIAALSPQWGALIAAWEELHATFIEEVGQNWSKGRRAPKTYQRMKEILAT